MSAKSPHYCLQDLSLVQFSPNRPPRHVHVHESFPINEHIDGHVWRYKVTGLAAKLAAPSIRAVRPGQTTSSQKAPRYFKMATSFDNPYVSALQTFYNDVGAKYDAMTHDFHSEGARCIVEAAGSNIRDGSFVLDLACGTGNVALTAASKVSPTGRVLGIDISDTFLAQATEKAGRLGLYDIAEFSHQDVTSLSLPAEFVGKKFDAVTCGSAIAMFPDIKAVVQVATKQLLKPGGVFVADMNSGNVPAGIFLDATVPHGFQPPFDPMWIIDPEQSLRDIFNGSDFEVKELVAKDNIAGTKEWSVDSSDKLEAVWQNLATYQTWVSFGIDKLPKEDLEAAKQDWIKMMNERKNEQGNIVGGMKQYIVVAALRSG